MPEENICLECWDKMLGQCVESFFDAHTTQERLGFINALGNSRFHEDVLYFVMAVWSKDNESTYSNAETRMVFSYFARKFNGLVAAQTKLSTSVDTDGITKLLELVARFKMDRDLSRFIEIALMEMS